MKNPKFSHKTPHLKGKQHQLDPNLDLKQLVHHAAVQYVDRDADGDVDVYDNPKRKTPDENPKDINVGAGSRKLLAKQKGEIKHTKVGMAYEEKGNGRCEPGKYYCYTDKKCKPIPAGFMVDPEGMLRKENGASIDEASRIPRKPGQPSKSDKHSDLYTDEDPKGTIQGLGFKDIETAKGSVSKIKNSGRSHAHKIQAAIAMEQRARVAGKTAEAAVYRKFINSMKEKTKEMNEEGLRDWFGKSKSKDGKPGWVNVVTGGTCASDEPGEGTPKCVSSAKRASMTKAERLSAARRKKAEDPGQQQKSGAAKPTYVSTDNPKKKMNEAKVRDHEYSMARSELSTIVNAAKRLQKKMAKGEGDVEAWVQSKITKAADYLDSAADYVDSGEMNKEETVLEAEGKKDACYNKVKSRYRVWPSAYASGALVKCRKVGADNWGNKSESVTIEDANGNPYVEFTDIIQPDPIKPSKGIVDRIIDEEGKKCWPGYEKKGTQKLFGKTYNRCVKKEEKEECNYTHKGEECPVHGKKECPDIVDEAVRIPAKTGNIVLITINWRGTYYSMKMFFPQVSKPTRKEVQDQIEKVYPGSKVQYYFVTDIKPGEQFLYTEDWQKVNRQDKTDGLSPAAVKAYRRENPGSKLQTAVTEKKPKGKRAKRRSSFCRRMKGMKSKLTSAKTARDPDSRINKALRRWNCN